MGKKNYKKNLTELNASKKLLSLRKKIIFLRSLLSTFIITKLTIDCGDIFNRQYLFGTTDVTEQILDNNENKIKNILQEF